MPADEGVRVRREGPILRVTLARPEKRNALSRAMMARLTAAFAGIAEGDAIRVVILDAEGPVFCAGGDIAEYAASAGTELDRANVSALSGLLATMVGCPAPVIARVHGDAHGGGVGLVCAADVAVAADAARFSLSEARLGLVPAAIAPYVIAALGERRAMVRMLLATPFDAADAVSIGLAHRHVPAGDLDATIDALAADLLRCAPGALAAVKRLPRLLAGRDSDRQAAIVADLHAERLASAEGREGLAAFLEKHRPAWSIDPIDPP